MGFTQHSLAISDVDIHPKSDSNPNPKPLIEFVLVIFQKIKKNVA